MPLKARIALLPGSKFYCEKNSRRHISPEEGQVFNGIYDDENQKYLVDTIGNLNTKAHIYIHRIEINGTEIEQSVLVEFFLWYVQKFRNLL